MSDWRTQLGEVAGYGEDWFDGGADGYWGKAIDPGCVARARALCAPLADAFPANQPHIDGDPAVGGVAIHWWRADRAALTIYAQPEGDYMVLALGVTGPFAIDRDGATLDEAIALAIAWLRGDVAT